MFCRLGVSLFCLNAAFTFIRHADSMCMMFLIRPSVQARACAAVGTVSLSRRVRRVMRRQTVWKRECVQASPQSAPSQSPRKTLQSAVRARVSAWAGWGSHVHHTTVWLNTVQPHCPISQCVQVNSVAKLVLKKIDVQIYIFWMLKGLLNHAGWKLEFQSSFLTY